MSTVYRVRTSNPGANTRGSVFVRARNRMDARRHVKRRYPRRVVVRVTEHADDVRCIQPDSQDGSHRITDDQTRLGEGSADA